jgi:hypothetical protein
MKNKVSYPEQLAGQTRHATFDHAIAYGERALQRALPQMPPLGGYGWRYQSRGLEHPWGVIEVKIRLENLGRPEALLGFRPIFTLDGSRWKGSEYKTVGDALREAASLWPDLVKSIQQRPAIEQAVLAHLRGRR